MTQDITQKLHLFIEATYPYEGSEHEYLFSDYTVEALSKRYRDSDTYEYWDNSGADILLYILKMDENGDLQYMYKMSYIPLETDPYSHDNWEEIK